MKSIVLFTLKKISFKRALYLALLLIINNCIISQEFDFRAHFEGTCQSVEFHDNYVYFNSGPNIHILDINNPEEIVLVNTFHSGYFFPVDINYSHGYLFISSGGKGFFIYDVSDPLQPEFISWVEGPYNLNAVESIIMGSVILIDEGYDQSISIYDISDLYNPNFLSQIEFPINQYHAYALKENLLYGFEISQSSNWDGYLISYDILDPANPQLANELKLCDANTGIYPDDMVVYEDNLLVAINDTVKIYNIALADTIFYLGKFPTSQTVNNLKLEGDTLFVYSEGEGIILISISDILNPVFLGSYDQVNTIQKFKIRNNLLLTSLGYKGFKLEDISEFSNPTVLFEFNQTDNVQAIEIQENIAYMGQQENGVQLIDISNPLNPIDLGNVDSVKRISKIEYNDDYLFCQSDIDYHTIHILDVNNPYNPEKVSEIYLDLHISDFEVQNDVLYLIAGGELLKFFNVTNPENPIEEASYNQDGHRMDVYGDLLVMTYNTGGKLYHKIKTFKLGSSYNIFSCDDTNIGPPPEYNPKEITINYPYIHIGVRYGVLIAKVDEEYIIDFCDEIVYSGWTTYTVTMISDNDNIFLGGHYFGSDQILIIDIQDPYNIFMTESINRACVDFGLKEDMLFTSEMQNGYSIYEDIPVKIPQESFLTPHKEMLVFPNPSNGVINFNLENGFSKKRYNIELFDTHGQQIKEVKNVQSSRYVMNVADLKPGVYFYVIREKGHVLQQGKVVIR